MIQARSRSLLSASARLAHREHRGVLRMPAQHIKLARRPSCANSWQSSQPPARPVVYTQLADRPQPRRDRDTGAGMSTVVGRLQECPVLGYKFITMAHNTVRGAAGGAILNAELMIAEGYLAGVSPAALTV